MSDGYQVQLPVFEGPLDLLLHLIEEQQLDITKVSLAQVTQQYLDYIAHAEAINPDQLADFLVVAAKLIYIKSTVLLPQMVVSEEEEEDAGDDLVRQLLLYRQFKQAAAYLRALEEQGNRAFVRVAPPVGLPRTVDLEDVTLDALVQAVREALAVAPPAPPVNDVVAPLLITVDEKIAFIQERLARRGRVSFRQLVRQARSRMEVIVTFLAVLEMVKRQLVEAYQEALFGEVFIAALKPPERRGEAPAGVNGNGGAPPSGAP
ncbi:MAG: segregation/condensation protein A [Chloroflexi bacterium]|nr:segregation/condensation protein A [Chloroflexota bacterium]